MNRLKETFYKLRYKLVYNLYQFLIKKLKFVQYYCGAQSVECREYCIDKDSLDLSEAKYNAVIDYLESIGELEDLNDKVEILLYDSRGKYNFDEHSIDILKFLIEKAEANIYRKNKYNRYENKFS